jgi:spermidine synthase
MHRPTFHGSRVTSESQIVEVGQTAEETDRRVLLAGTALVSFASLLLELALTRLFSVVLYYHFAFLAISLAMLGLGVGGVFAYLRRDWLAGRPFRKLASSICAFNAAYILVALFITLHSSVTLELEIFNLMRLAEIYLLAGIPFFFTGLLFSVMFARETKDVTRLYGADLAGGAVACMAVVPLLNMLGGPNVVICAALVMMVAAGIWAETPGHRKGAMCVSLLLVAMIAANHSERFIDVVYGKGRLVAGPQTEFSQWNAISRIEVDNFTEGKAILIDADAATAIMSADPHDPKSITITNLLRPHGDYAIIGPGGGTDVLGAVAAGSPNVTGIEINPIIANTIMRGRYAEYAHHLYDLPQVHIHVSEGRSWIRSSEDKYDVIQMTLVDTWASTSAGAFALSENNLYTVEAFREYFDHLKPDGLIAVTRWEFARPREALRVVSQAIEMLRRAGIEDARAYLMVVANQQPDQAGTRVTVLVKKTPFTHEEERTVLQQVRADSDLYPLYTPNVYSNSAEVAVCGSGSLPSSGGNCIEADLARLAADRRAPSETMEPFQRLINLPWRTTAAGRESSPRGDFIRDYPFEIAPVTDNNPFFFFTFKTGSAVRGLIGSTTQGSIDWKNNLGVAVLWMMLIISVVAVLGFLIGPLALHEAAHRPPLTPLLYFVAIGLGYILVEIALIQRFVLFLGHPTYAMTVVVFLMLLSGGAGSVASKRWLHKTSSARGVLWTIAGIVTLYVLFLHALLAILVALPFAAKLMLSGALLVPLGLLMGMPFPTGLREIATFGNRLTGETSEQFSKPVTRSSTIEWAWALNAASSVLGSVLAIVVALHFGLDAALGCAAGAYLFAAVLTLRWQRQPIGVADHQAGIHAPRANLA